MIWSSMSVMMAAELAMKAHQAQLEAYKHSFRREAAQPKVRPQGKCSSCGSSDFKKHNQLTICSYCRSAT